MTLTWVAPAAGVLLLALVLRDVVLTVFHPEGFGGRIFRVVSGMTWGAFRWFARFRGWDGRNDFMSMAGPTMAVLMPVTWVTALVVGFALIYLPWVLELVDLPGELGPPWAEAVFHSINAASTLGTGNVTADSVALRWITTIQAMAGFGMLTAALSYFMGVFRELPNQRSVALEISARLADESAYESLQDPEQWRDWETWFEHVARVLHHGRYMFSQYPILHYFRPRRRGDEFLLQLGVLLDLRERLDDGADHAARSATFRSLNSAVEDYILALHRQFVGGTPHRRDVSPAELRQLHRGVLRHFMLP